MSIIVNIILYIQYFKTHTMIKKGVIKLLLMTIVYDEKIKDIIGELSEVKETFSAKKINFGIVESMEANNHIVKIFCEDKDYNERTVQIFNIYFGEIIYDVIAAEFLKQHMEYFINENYFFLKEEEIFDVKNVLKDAIICKGKIMNDDMIFYLNRKNAIVKKIIACNEQNSEFNINGFITFRMKELLVEFESIAEKVIEKYMAEKEYNEFIKLLKYFVEIQESKINEVNIIIKEQGQYIMLDDSGNNILEFMLTDIYEADYHGSISMEDVIISGLITNSPQRIILHCVELCDNMEFVETIKNVFCDRVIMCDGCKICNRVDDFIKI